MLRVQPKSIIALIAVFTLCTCIDPYTPELSGYESLLVVDGLVTDANSSYSIKLSRTIQEQNAEPEKVSDATVYITDELGISSFLNNKGDGTYITDSIEFKGIIGKKYTLHILTSDGNEYESESCYMESVPDIEKLYFTKDQEIISNATETTEGIRIYLDSKVSDGNKYYRWDFEETWKFRVPSPKKYNYIDSVNIYPVAKINEFCWKNRKSDELLIHSVFSGQSDHIEKKPIFFIATDKSDRMLIQYSILVNQYSISKEEYDFWNNLKRINESGDDIFATQPFPVISNIHNINNIQEQVLGYFQVSAVKQKRLNISFADIVGLNLPLYNYQCERLELAPEDIPMSKYAAPLTWSGLYRIYCISSDYYFVEPRYNQETNDLEKMVFARPECADCTIEGSPIQPDFWIDLN